VITAERLIVVPEGGVSDGGPVQLGLLKGFELRHRGQIVRLPLSAQRLLAFLAIHDRALQRLYVAGTLWIDSSQDSANANLRTTLWRLRRPGCDLVEATPTELALAGSVVVDLRGAMQTAQRVLAHDGDSSDLGALCVAGDLLPDWYDDWLLVERERFRQMRLHALEALAEDLVSTGRFAAAAEAALAAVAAEPLRESAHRVLVKLHLAEGNIGEAIRQYRTYSSLLYDGLGLEPSPAMENLVRSLPAAAGLLRAVGA
jgi:DNA-binding SARP family transcriptional activator